MSTQAMHPIILIVEDSADDYALLSRAFRACGLTQGIKWCRNGIEALEFLQQNSGHTAFPAVIISDIKMPLMDGFEFVAQVKAHPHLRHIPFFFLSASEMNRDIEKAWESGAVYLFLKPSESKDLVPIAVTLKNYLAEKALLPPPPPATPSSDMERLYQPPNLQPFSQRV